MKHLLSDEYPSVIYRSHASYGGDQRKSENKTVREVGCGLVAGLDLLFYLSRSAGGGVNPLFQGQIPSKGQISSEEYERCLNVLRRRYLPLIPGHGINGLLLALGLNAFFLGHHMPYTASWGVPLSKLWAVMEAQLDRNIPVILSAGPNFPALWRHHKLKLYFSRSDGSYIPVTETHAHYVTVTGMDEQWLRVSSWGGIYFISRREYMEYIKKYSSALVSNMLYIKRKERREG